jgi:hypothetical protein
MPDTYVEGVSGEKLVFKFGDGASPTEAFTEECTINTDRSIEFTSDIAVSQRANCTDPSKPAKSKRRVKATDIRFTGAGTASAASALKLIQLWQAGASFNGKVIQDAGVALHGFTITGKWVIENITLGGTRGDDQTFSIALAIADTDYTFTAS